MTPHKDLITIPAIEDVTRRRLFASALAAGLLIACGEDDDAPDDGGTVTIDDYFGPATIPVNPRRVVSSDEAIMGYMIALDIAPIASYINPTVSRDYLGDLLGKVEDITNVADFEIDFERALALDPDLLILATDDRALVEQYRRTVPTFGWWTEGNSLDQVRDSFFLVAQALQREERARAVFGEIEVRLADFRLRVSRLSTPPKVNLLRVWSDRLQIRFNEAGNSLIEESGIEWLVGPDKAGEFSLEQLRVLNDADALLVFLNEDAGANFQALQANPLWQGLEPVKRGAVHEVASGPWKNQDPRALHIILDDIERLIIAPAERR